MTWETLQAQASDFGSEQQWIAQAHAATLSGAESPELIFITEAKADLAREIQQRVGLDIGDSDQLATVDASVDSYQKQWRYILSLKQLCLVYEALDQGEGSMNRMKAQRYHRQYNDQLMMLRSLFTDSGRPHRHTSVRLSL